MARSRLRSAAAAALLLAAPPPAGASPAVERAAAAADEALRQLADEGLAGAVLLLHDDRVVLRRGYGLAERRSGLAVDADMAFDVGSIAKTFTAAAALKLAERGELDLEAPIRRYLDGVPADKAAVTLAQLLSHTSGLDNHHARGDFAPMGREEAVRRALALELESPPGSAES